MGMVWGFGTNLLQGGVESPVSHFRLAAIFEHLICIVEITVLGFPGCQETDQVRGSRGSAEASSLSSPFVVLALVPD
jgi:hypothetical protein